MKSDIRDIEIRANANYPILREGHPENKIRNAQFHAYCKGAKDQKKFDDAEQSEEMRKLNEEWQENLRIQKKMLIDTAISLLEKYNEATLLASSGIWAIDIDKFKNIMEGKK